MVSTASLLLALAASLVRAAPDPTTPSASSNSSLPSSSSAYRIVYDDFSQGFSVNSADAKWSYFAFGPYVASDGVVSTFKNGNPAANGNSGLRVVSPGKGPQGTPAFTLSAPPGDAALPGDIDHPKWLAFMTHASSAGYAGYDTEAGYVTACEARVGGEVFGTAPNPFGLGPNDPALGVAALVAADFETFLIFDFVLSNDAIYALYERLPYGRTPDNNYASFTHLVRVAKRTPTQDHDLRIAYDRTGRHVEWYVGGRRVFSVDRIGFYLPDNARTHALAIDRGGAEQDAGDLRQLVCGVGAFTLLDAYDYGRHRALVRLVDAPEGYYRNPENASAPLAFVDESSTQGSRLWGQGAELRVQSVVVSKTKRK